jgi:hypothetical protein
MYRTDIDGFLDFFFRRPFREHYHGPTQGFVENEDLRTDFHTGVAADTGIFVNNRYAGHIVVSFFQVTTGQAKKPVPTDNLILIFV